MPRPSPSIARPVRGSPDLPTRTIQEHTPGKAPRQSTTTNQPCRWVACPMCCRRLPHHPPPLPFIPQAQSLHFPRHLPPMSPPNRAPPPPPPSPIQSILLRATCKPIGSVPCWTTTVAISRPRPRRCPHNTPPPPFSNNRPFQVLLPPTPVHWYASINHNC